MVRERLERMGLPVTEAAARSLVEALLAFEGPRLYAQAQSNLENSPPGGTSAPSGTNRRDRGR